MDYIKVLHHPLFHLRCRHNLYEHANSPHAYYVTLAACRLCSRALCQFHYNNHILFSQSRLLIIPKHSEEQHVHRRRILYQDWQQFIMISLAEYFTSFWHSYIVKHLFQTFVGQVIRKLKHCVSI